MDCVYKLLNFQNAPIICPYLGSILLEYIFHIYFFGKGYACEIIAHFTGFLKF